MPGVLVLLLVVMAGDPRTVLLSSSIVLATAVPDVQSRDAAYYRRQLLVRPSCQIPNS